MNYRHYRRHSWQPSVFDAVLDIRHSRKRAATAGLVPMNYRQIDIVIVTALTGVNSILHMAPRVSFGVLIFSLFFFSLTGVVSTSSTRNHSILLFTGRSLVNFAIYESVRLLRYPRKREGGRETVARFIRSWSSGKKQNSALFLCLLSLSSSFIKGFLSEVMFNSPLRVKFLRRIDTVKQTSSVDLSD